MTQGIQFRRKPKVPKELIIALSVIAAVAVVVVAVLVINHVKKDKWEIEKIGKGESTWSTEGFEYIKDAQVLDEKLIIFTDSESGKKGIMTFDGTITEEAEHDSFYVVSDAWRSKRYIVETPISEYTLLVDAKTGTVSSRQYHGLTEPEKTAYWEETYDYLAWHGERGYIGKVKTSEVALGDGFYPVSTPESQGGKWGYINKNLSLETDLRYDKAMDFYGDYAAVSADGSWGYINTDFVTLIDFEYESVSELDVMGENCAFAFRDGLAPVKKDGKYGVIDTSGEAVVNFVFEAILPGEDGCYIAKKDGKWGKITVDKSALTADTTQESEDSNRGGAAIESGNYVVKTSGSPLNMRNEPNGETKIAMIPNGSTVTVSSYDGGWAYVKYGKYQGWVSSQFLEKATEYATVAATVTSTAVQTTQP